MLLLCLTLAHTLALPQKYFSSLHSTHPRLSSYHLETGCALKVNFTEKKINTVHGRVLDYTQVFYFILNGVELVFTLQFERV